MVYEKVIAMLDAGGCPYTIHAHPPVGTIEEARQKVEHLTRNLLKTVVFRIRSGQWILAAVQGFDRIDYRKLAEALRVKRTDLRSVSPREVEEDLGFEVGGVGPFPIREDVEVILDQGLLGLDSIFCGSGVNTRTVEIRLADLLKATRARVHPIVKE